MSELQRMSDDELEMAAGRLQAALDRIEAEFAARKAARDEAYLDSLETPDAGGHQYNRSAVVPE